MKHFMTMLAILSGMCGSLFAQDKGSVQKATEGKDPVISTVALSEMTLDQTLGSNGSWVELWNPADQAIDLEDHALLIDGKEVRPFPKGLVLKAKGFVVVRFEKHEAVGVDDLMKSLRKANSTIVWHDPILSAETKRRPGFCALYASDKASTPRHLLDVVRWGDKYSKIPPDQDESLVQAKKAGLPAVEVVDIGLTRPSQEGPIVPLDKSVLKRLKFKGSKRNRSDWAVMEEEFASPGTGNLLPPPVVIGSVGCSMQDDTFITTRIGFTINLGHEFFELLRVRSKDSKMYRFQIATDPHFVNVIMDQRVNDRYRPANNFLKPGSYFLRGCFDDCGMSTDWSKGYWIEIPYTQKNFSTYKPPKSIPVPAFSRMTMDKIPGSEGSWIEMWNPGDCSIDLKDYLLVIDNQEINAFPQKTRLEAKRPIRIRFEKKPERGSVKLMRRPWDNICVTAWHDPVVVQDAKKPNGFCALYAPGGKEISTTSRIQDYVRWGKRAPGKDKHLTSAIKAGLWGQEDIELPLPAMENPWPQCAPVLSRQKFNPGSGNRDCWMVLEARQAQRGFGNLLLPPAVIRPGLCAEVSAMANLTIDFEPPPGLQARIPNPQDEKTLIRLQIATDPHFSDVVLDQSAGLHSELAKGTLKPGIYFIRSRIDCRSQVSDWSEGQVFYLRE